MSNLNPGRIALIVLAVITLGLLAYGGHSIYERTRAYEVIIAAGAAKSESHVIMGALKTVVEKYHPRIRITVHETAGTLENLHLLERGQAQLATSQADTAVGPHGRAVAALYDDTFQLLVHKDSPVTQFSDFKATDTKEKKKRIAIPKSGGQFQTFLFVARHFGLHESDFDFIGQSDEAGDVAFARGEADALFRVRAIHNSAINRLATTGNIKFLPIEQASAMHVEMPAYNPATIPKGAYLGNPAVPASDLPTVSVQRNLVAHRDVPEDVIFAIVQVLIERKQEIANAIPESEEFVRPLLAGIKQPSGRVGLEGITHPGATAYFDPDRPSLVRKNADLLVAVLLGFALLRVWSVTWKQAARHDQKVLADKYNLRLAQILDEAQQANSEKHLVPLRSELTKMLTMAIRDLRHDKLSEESFQAFRSVWQICFEVIRERKSAVERRPLLHGAAAAGAGENGAESKKSWWSLGKFLS